MLAKTNAVHEAWAAAERTLDFKVTVNGTTYTATDITELDFDAGDMNGDALTLGSTYANTVKIIFSHLVEGLALTNEVTPEIGIQLPDGTWDYTALGVFVIDSQVEQDRNNNTTTVSATDRFVMMGGTYTSKLDYPADVLDVATEIADQAGVQINATDIGHLPAAQVPSAIAGATLREAIGFVAQFCAGFATFDRDGQLSIRTLNDPEFTITTNQYQSKGLTKNEVMYQVDGLTCEVEARDDAGSSDTVTLQSGNTTGNQIVLTNPVMTQNALDGLYTQLQDTNFYPFSLDWFGDPSVEVGDWIEIVDAAGNKFKTPNLLFALTFNGSLTATSKADTTVTANSNFSYVNTNNKRIIRDLRARIDASGHKITDGTEAPENPKLGDIWFAKDGPDTIIRIWTLNPDTGEAYWKDEVSTKTTSDIAAQIDEIMKQLKADEDALAEKLAANDAAQTVLNGKLDDNAAAITKAKQDTDSAVADVTAKVKQAADDTAKAVSQASDAAATATNALTIAQTADSTSTDAKQSAAEAIDTANQAQVDAKAAQDGAAGAVTDAKTALDNAGDALAQAQNALKSGQDALSGVEGLRNSSSINLIVPTEHTMHPGVGWGEMNLGTFTPDYNSDGTYTIQLDVECPELEGPTLSTEIGFRVLFTNGWGRDYIDDADSGSPSFEAAPDQWTVTKLDVGWRLKRTFTFTLPEGGALRETAHIVVSVSRQKKSRTITMRNGIVIKGATLTQASIESMNLQKQVTLNSTGVDANAKAIALKADQTTVDKLNDTTQQNSAELQVTAKQVDLTAAEQKIDIVSGKVDKAAADISLQAGQIEAKAEKSSVDALSDVVKQQEVTVQQNSDALKTKAESSEINTLTGQYNDLKSETEQTAKGFTQSLSEVNESLNSLSSGTHNYLAATTSPNSVGYKANSSDGSYIVKTAVIDEINVVKFGAKAVPTGWKYMGYQNFTEPMVWNVGDTWTLSARIYAFNGGTDFNAFIKQGNGLNKVLEFDFCELKAGWNTVIVRGTVIGTGSSSVMIYWDSYTFKGPGDLFAIEWMVLSKGNVGTADYIAPEESYAKADDMAAISAKTNDVSKTVAETVSKVASVEITANQSLTTANTAKQTADANTETIAQVKTTTEGTQTQVNSIVSDANGTKQEVSSIKTAIQTGGRNLLQGTSRDLIATETSHWGIAYGGTNANSGIIVNHDMPYVFRVWIDKAPFDYHAEVYLWKADRTLSELAVHSIVVGNTITAGNSGYSTAIVTPKLMGSDVAMLRPDIATNSAHGAASFTVNHCQEKLELGDLATTWSPAPEDLATAESVHTVETTLTKSLDQLTTAQGQTASDLLTATNKLTTVEDTANQAKSLSSQNASDLLLRVEKANLLSEINLQAGSTLIKTGKLYLDAATVTFSGAAIIPSAAIMSLDATKITTGTLDASKATIINLNADNIVSGSIDTEKVTLKNLSASSIVSGELDASKVTVSNLSASNIIGGTLDANLVTVKDLSASSITSGTLNAGLLNVINLNADSITTGTLSGANLSMNLNTGEVLFTSGAITGTGMNMNLDSGVIDFTQGRFHDDAGTIDLNVDDGYIATSSGDSQMVLSQGKLLLTQKNIFDPYSATPYLEIANNVTGDSLASASIIGRDSVTVCNSANTGSIISMGVETLAGLFAGKATDGWKMTKVGGADRGVIISGGKMSGGALGYYSPSIVVGCDSSGGGKGRDRISIGASYVHIPSTYSRTISGSANVHVSSDGALVRSTSAAKYKTDILRTTSSAIGHKLLGIQTATWIDKADQARYASDPNHYERPSRNFGMIADDLDAAGIPELVTYVDGEIEGINYDRIGPALVPVIRELNDKVNQLEALYNAIKNDKLTA